MFYIIPRNCCLKVLRKVLLIKSPTNPLLLMPSGILVQLNGHINQPEIWSKPVLVGGIVSNETL